MSGMLKRYGVLVSYRCPCTHHVLRRPQVIHAELRTSVQDAGCDRKHCCALSRPLSIEPCSAFNVVVSETQPDCMQMTAP